MTSQGSSFKTFYKFAQFYSLLYVVQTYGIDISQCLGPSMMPTLNSAGDIVLVNKMIGSGNLQKGMVVIAASPTDPHKTICKRVKAVEGETIDIDWTPFQRSRSHFFEIKSLGFERKKPDDPYFKIPIGHVWLEGDNSKNSTDSRVFGPVSNNLISGVVMCRIWPNFRKLTQDQKSSK